jgi:hypothetical protein
MEAWPQLVNVGVAREEKRREERRRDQVKQGIIANSSSTNKDE